MQQKVGSAFIEWPLFLEGVPLAFDLLWVHVFLVVAMIFEVEEIGHDAGVRLDRTAQFVDRRMLMQALNKHQGMQVQIARLLALLRAVIGVDPAEHATVRCRHGSVRITAIAVRAPVAHPHPK